MHGPASAGLSRKRKSVCLLWCARCADTVVVALVFPCVLKVVPVPVNLVRETAVEVPKAIEGS